MKIRLKNNTNLQLQSIQNKTSVESLYITGCPKINNWDIFNSIYNTSGNRLRSVRIDGINHIGTWSELQDIKLNLHGLDPTGTETSVPVLIGTWTLPGMYPGEHDLEAEKTIWGGTLDIEVDKTLISFSDSTVNSIVNSLWGFEYDHNLYGVDINSIRSISDIGQNFSGTNITTFPEFSEFTGVSSLNNGAFYGCTNLVNISLPSSILVVGDDIFSGCTNLTSITYPESTSVIGSNQTTGCTNLEYVRILRSSLTSIQEDSFVGNYKIYVGDGSSPWHDNNILNILLANNTWKIYEDRLDTWYNKLYKDIIPSNYKKLDYIESDAYNYITTNVEFTNNTRFVADISFLSASESIYGSSQSGIRGVVGGGLKFTVISKNTDNEMAVTFFNTSAWIDSGENLYDIDIKNGLISFNGTNLLNAQVKSNGGDITLFGDENNKYIGRTWMTRIYENDVLIHDFVPVYKKSSLEAGLYDVVTNTFSGFSTYTGDGFDTRLITENKKRITTENNESILVSNVNTDKIKISKMDQGVVYDDYYTPLANFSGDNRKYNLGLLNSEISKIYNTSGIIDFRNDIYYESGKFVSYQGNTYKFINNHIGPWNSLDVINTSAFSTLMDINKVQNKETLNVQLISKDPVYLDWIKSTGDQYINTTITIGNSTTHTIELKFKYDNFVPDNWIFGDYKSAAYGTTWLKLGANNDGSGTCGLGTSYSSAPISIPAGVLTAGVDHTVILTSGSVTIDGNTYTNTVIEGTENTNTLGLFSSNGSGTSISNLGITLYYFKIHNGTKYIFDAKPAIKLGHICLHREGNNTAYKNSKSGGDYFDIPNNFNSPFENKNINISFIGESNNNINVKTDFLGKATTFFRRDKYFTITPETPTGFYSTEVSMKNYYNMDTDNCKILFEKIEVQENCTLIINISLSDGSSIPSSFGGKILYVLSDFNSLFSENTSKVYKYATISINNGRIELPVTFPKNKVARIVFPTITGYTKQSDIVVMTDDNEKIINAIYTAS